MKKLLIGLVLFGSSLIGCTTGETAIEHNRRYALQGDVQMRLLVEDWDEFWLIGQSSRLTRWSSRLGY